MPVKLADARHFFLEFQDAERAHHFADGDSGVIRPENAAILLFVVVKAHFVTIGLSERFSIPQLGTPRKQRVTEVELLDQGALRRRDLRGNLAGGLEYRSVMPPGARDNVTTIRFRAERGLRSLRRLRGPGDQFRALARQFAPTIPELHVVTDLNSEFAEVAVEDRQRVAGRGAALHSSALERNDEMHFAVGPYCFTVAPDENGGVGALFPCFGIQQVGRDHEITSVLACLPA